MRWGYKTIQYGLKKEGLLGGGFLDEAEVEQSLNEFGQAGWELVSLFGMQDGLMAVFKQPLDVMELPVQKSDTAQNTTTGHRFSLQRQNAGEVEKMAERKKDHYEPVISVTVGNEEKEEGVGAIRIE